MLANDTCQTQRQQDDDSCSDAEDSSLPSCTYRPAHHSSSTHSSCFVGTSIRQSKHTLLLNNNRILIANVSKCIGEFAKLTFLTTTLYNNLFVSGGHNLRLKQ